MPVEAATGETQYVLGQAKGDEATEDHLVDVFVSPQTFYEAEPLT